MPIINNKAVHGYPQLRRKKMWQKKHEGNPDPRANINPECNSDTINVPKYNNKQ